MAGRQRQTVGWWWAAVVMCGAGLAHPAAMASCKIQQMEIPVRMVDRRPVATLVLNGTEVPMLVDSGSFFSLLSTTAAAQLKLPLRELPWDITIEGYTGKVAAKLTTVETVGLRDASLKQVEFIVGGNQLGAGIMGVMGRNFLAIADTEYDLAQGVVRLVMPGKDCAKANLAYWAGDAPVVELPLLSGASRNDAPILLDVSINGAKQQALFDTGAPGTSLSLKAARRAGIKASDMTPVNRAGGVGQGLVSRWTAPVDLFEVGGEKVRNSRLQVDDVDSENGLLVGLDYFLSHRIYVSRMQQRVYITWNGTPIFPPGGGAAGTYDSRYAALPQAVAADDADALARRGAAFLAAGQHARALDDLNRACELKPTVAEYRMTRAQVHLKTKNTQAALADLDEALRLDSALAQARFDRAWLQHFLKNQAASLADLQLLDNQLPPSAHLRANMADLFTDQMQAQDALKQFALWLESHPQDARRAQMLNSRCWLRVRLNQDLPLALEDCKKSIRLDDEEANTHDSLGWVYLRMADLSRAKRAFDASIKLKPLAYSHYGRSLVHLRSGDKAQSDRDLAEARRLQPKIDLLVQEEGFAALEGVASLAASVDP